MAIYAPVCCSTGVTSSVFQSISLICHKQITHQELVVMHFDLILIFCIYGKIGNNNILLLYMHFPLGISLYILFNAYCLSKCGITTNSFKFIVVKTLCP